jgi:hypothetical protein
VSVMAMLPPVRRPWRRYPEYTDSGIAWLGQVPSHWAISRIKWVATMESGHTPDRKVEAYWTDCTIPWVSLNDTGHLKDHDYITETACYVNDLGIANSSARLLPERLSEQLSSPGMRRSGGVASLPFRWQCHSISSRGYVARNFFPNTCFTFCGR